MAAVVQVHETNGGATPSHTNIASNSNGGMRFCTADSTDPGTNNPLVKPAAGTNYSYEKYHRIYVDSGLTGTLDNVEWFTDGTTSWTGVEVYAGAASSYSDPIDDATPSTIASTNAESYVTGSPLSLTGSITGSGYGDVQYVVLQARVDNTASAGEQTDETYTFRYDET